MSRKKFNPISIRLCRQCKAFRRYKYDNILGHSNCVVCGSRWGLKAEVIIDIIQRAGFDLNKVCQEGEQL